MKTLAVSALALLGTVCCSAQLWAQPVPERVPRRDPGVIIDPITVPPASDGRVSWEDNNCHVKVTALYDGRRVKILNVASGEGSARSYLSQRSDIVVLLLNEAKEIVRQFNLPDPLELRVWEQPPSGASDTLVPTIGVPAMAARRIPRFDPDPPREQTTHVESAQFEVMVPQLQGAKWIQFRSHTPKGRLLGKVDLTNLLTCIQG